MRSFVCAVLFVSFASVAADVTDLKAEVEALRKQITAREQSKSAVPMRSSVDAAIDNKYGPNASVKTRNGKLTISGLMQTWYYSIQNYNTGFFGDIDTNETRDNDSFRIRRAELKFGISITKNVEAVIMFDPAREMASFPGADSNLGTALRVRSTGTSATVTNVQTGAGTAARMMKDGYIAFKDYVPHHDFMIGQFKPQLGEEGIRSASELDFAERALITQLVDFRDIGAVGHGTWVDDRVQYWFGAFNSPGNFHNSGGQFSDRSDDNDEKSMLYRVLIRPVWKHETWGSLELGMSSMFGTHGESGSAGDPINGLNRERNWAIRHYGWASYMPGGPVRGLWLRGEWAWIKDRNIPNAVRGFPQDDSDLNQATPNPFSVTGFYVSAGYRISISAFKDCAPSWLKPFEFALRYQQFENITVGDLVRPESRTDTFASKIVTAGINYYIKNHNAKIQLNYNWADEPGDINNFAERGFREVRNDSLVVNFQVGF